MNIQMERRIRKAEKTVATMKPANRQVKIMFPPDNGDAADEARYQAEYDQAIRDGCFVIRIVPLQPLPPKVPA